MTDEFTTYVCSPFSIFEEKNLSTKIYCLFTVIQKIDSMHLNNEFITREMKEKKGKIIASKIILMKI